VLGVASAAVEADVAGVLARLVQEIADKPSET
jgi:hypothetical protein